MSSSLIFLDTRDGTALNGPSDSHFSLHPTHPELYNKIRFRSISLVNGVYPINDSNNLLNFVENGTTSNSINIDNGFYTGSSLATKLSSQLSGATLESITYTVTYSSLKSALTISCDSTNLFRVVSTSTCLDVLGFEATGAVDAGTTQGTLPVRLDGSQYIDVTTNLYSANNISSNDKRITHRIPLTGAFGEYIHYDVEDSQFVTFNGRTESVDIRLTDDRGNLFRLPSNCHIQYVLELSS